MSFINIQENGSGVISPSMLSKFTPIWNLNVSNPNIVTSSSTVYVTKKDGVDCIYISAVSGTTIVNLNPALFRYYGTDNIKKLFKITLKSNGISGTTSNVIMKYVDQYDSSNHYMTTYFSSGTYDWTTFDSIIPNFSKNASQPEYLRIVLVGPCEVWISNISVDIFDIVYDRTLSTSSYTPPNKIGRGMQINSVASLKDMIDLKNTYNGNVVRLEITPISWSYWMQLETSNAGVPWLDNQVMDSVTVDKMSVSSYYNWIDYKLQRIDEILGFAKRNDIKVIIDMHTAIGSITNDISPYCIIDDTYCEHFYKIWEIIATRYKDNPAIFAYDLINEPYEKKSFGRNKLSRNYINFQQNTIDIIRKIDKNVPLIVEFSNYTNPANAAYLSAFPDKNLIYSIHTYFPGTFVDIDNTTSAYPSGCYYNSKPVDKSVLREILEPTRQFQLKYQVPIFVGEFSCYRWNPGGNQFLNDYIELFDEYGWHWTYFSFRCNADSWDLEFNDLPVGQNNSEFSISSTPRNEAVRLKMISNSSLYDTSAIPMISAIISATQFNDKTVELSWNWPECYVQQFSHATKLSSATSWGSLTNQAPLTASVLNSATYQNLSVSSNYDFMVNVSSVYGSVSSTNSIFVDRLYPLSSTTDSSRIYSLRKVLPQYSGNCIRIRRNSDNSELDIGFDSVGYLDLTSISAFCGTSSNGYIAKWYDQINGVDLVNSATTTQPTIYTSALGVEVLSSNGLPCVNFGNYNNSILYNFSPSLWNSNRNSIFIVKKDTQTSANYSASVIGEYSTSSLNPLYAIVKLGNASIKMYNSSIRNDLSTTIFDNKTTSGSNISGTHQLSIIDSRNNLKVYPNNGNVDLNYNYSVSGTLTVSVLSVGARRRTFDDSWYKGYVQEILLFSESVSEEYIRYIAKNQKNHYYC